MTAINAVSYTALPSHTLTHTFTHAQLHTHKYIKARADINTDRYQKFKAKKLAALNTLQAHTLAISTYTQYCPCCSFYLI